MRRCVLAAICATALSAACPEGAPPRGPLVLDGAVNLRVVVPDDAGPGPGLHASGQAGGGHQDPRGSGQRLFWRRRIHDLVHHRPDLPLRSRHGGGGAGQEEVSTG